MGAAKCNVADSIPAVAVTLRGALGYGSLVAADADTIDNCGTMTSETISKRPVIEIRLRALIMDSVRLLGPQLTPTEGTTSLSRPPKTERPCSARPEYSRNSSRLLMAPSQDLYKGV